MPRNLSHPNPAFYYARTIYKALRGVGTDEITIIRHIVNSSEYLLKNVKDEFLETAGYTLDKGIKKGFRGDARHLLRQVVRGNGFAAEWTPEEESEDDEDEEDVDEDEAAAAEAAAAEAAAAEAAAAEAAAAEAAAAEAAAAEAAAAEAAWIASLPISERLERGITIHNVYIMNKMNGHVLEVQGLFCF